MPGESRGIGGQEVGTGVGGFGVLQGNFGPVERPGQPFEVAAVGVDAVLGEPALDRQPLQVAFEHPLPGWLGLGGLLGWGGHDDRAGPAPERILRYAAGTAAPQLRQISRISISSRIFAEALACLKISRTSSVAGSMPRSFNQ